MKGEIEIRVNKTGYDGEFFLKRIQSAQLRSVMAAIGLGLALTGCAQNLAHHLTLQEIKRVDSLYQQMPPVDPDYGRVIVYWEKHPVLPVTGRFELEGSAGYLVTGFGSQMGTIIELPVGQYTISSGGWVNRQSIHLDVAEGNASCFNTETVYSFISGPMSGAMNAVPIEDCLA
jgi:hypothetical protein